MIDSVLVDDDVRALRPLVGFVLDVVALEDAVFLQLLLVHVAEQRELDIALLGKGGVRCGTIHAYAENFRVGGINLSCGYSRLDRLELLGSTAGERNNINSEKHVLLATVVAELHVPPLIAKQREIRRGVTNFRESLAPRVFEFAPKLPSTPASC
jgi:hypothetical protein